MPEELPCLTWQSTILRPTLRLAHAKRLRSIQHGAKAAVMHQRASCGLPKLRCVHSSYDTAQYVHILLPVHINNRSTRLSATRIPPNAPAMTAA